MSQHSNESLRVASANHVLQPSLIDLFLQIASVMALLGALASAGLIVLSIFQGAWFWAIFVYPALAVYCLAQWVVFRFVYEQLPAKN